MIREFLQLSLARSIARHAVLHSCNSGDGMSPATMGPKQSELYEKALRK